MGAGFRCGQMSEISPRLSGAFFTVTEANLDIHFYILSIFRYHFTFIFNYYFTYTSFMGGEASIHLRKFIPTSFSLKCLWSVFVLHEEYLLWSKLCIVRSVLIDSITISVLYIFLQPPLMMQQMHAHWYHWHQNKYSKILSPYALNTHHSFL